MRLTFVILVWFLVASGFSQTYTEIENAIKGADESSAKAALSRMIRADSDLADDVEELGQSKPKLERLRAIIAQRAAAERSSELDQAWVTKAKEAKSKNPLYRDDDKGKQGGNWLAKAYEKLGEAIERLFNRRGPEMPNISPPSVLFGPWLVYLMWGILGAVLLVCLYLAIRHFSWRAKLKRKTTGLMGDDEPERTLDEWLTLADQYEREGKYREAVRCLYLACLLKFDEYRVARFDRGQTNWEHLERIQASASMPVGLDFLAPTKSFDRVWYGQMVEGKPDVDRFRTWYLAVVSSLKGGAS